MQPFVRKDIDQPRNPNYKKDIVYVTRHNKWVLNSLGVWPVMLKGVGKFLPKIAIGLYNLVLFFILMQCVLHVVFEQKDPVMILKVLGLICFIFISIMKYWALTARKSTIEYCIGQLYADWKQVEFQRDRKLMMKYGKLGRRLTMYSAVFMYCGGLSYVTLYAYVMQYAYESYVDEFNRTIKMLLYPTYSALYDVQKSPVHEIMYLLQCMCEYVSDSVTAGACGLAALFVTHVCGQIDVVMSRIEDLIDGKFAEEDTSLNVRLVEIVQHHIRTLKFSAMIETVLQEVCFFEFFGSTFIICLLEYYCIVDWEQDDKIGLTTYSLLLTSLTFNMFLLCYIGDLLIEKSTNVGITCCMIDWYRLPAKTIQDLILVIAMSNNPSKISAGRIVDLSLASFGSVLKTSFAYLNFIRTTVT